MNFKEAKQKKQELYDKVSEISDKLNAYPKNDFGLTPDDVKKDPAYRVLKKDYEEAFYSLQNFNSMYVKTFKACIREEVKSRRSN